MGDLIKTSKFTGYDSEDFGSMCFAVTAEDFEKITGEKAERKDPSHLDRFCLYPDSLMPAGIDNKLEYEFEITVVARLINP